MDTRLCQTLGRAGWLQGRLCFVGAVVGLGRSFLSLLIFLITINASMIHRIAAKRHRSCQTHTGRKERPDYS